MLQKQFSATIKCNHIAGYCTADAGYQLFNFSRTSYIALQPVFQAPGTSRINKYLAAACVH